ncbi:MAG TPA: endonuclease/exonuclease/phosphatase family protein [Candidatus Hydrogenedentes bacterium]|nr:endonuclease/exonuclease/phosphatase family protein [Candidatus Hydrogenedentota bacterium]
MMNRRRFLGIAGAGLLSLGAGGRANEKKDRFRTISYNVLAFRGYPNNRKTQTRIKEKYEQHPVMTANALVKFSPDIVTLQEAPPEDRVAQFAKTLEMPYAYFPGGWEGDTLYPGGFPGAIVTRFKIEESTNRPSAGAPHDKELFTRHLGYAKLAAPFGTLHVVSAHFHPMEREIRMREAAAIIEFVAQLRGSGPVLFQGDLNHRPEDPEYALWGKAGLVDIGKAMGIGDKPTVPSVRPRNRIDYIWATPELAKRAQRAEVLDKTPFIPEPDDPASYALSDHLPVMAEFLMAG